MPLGARRAERVNALFKAMLGTVLITDNALFSVGVQLFFHRWRFLISLLALGGGNSGSLLGSS
jgi:hypothetical protein